MNNNLTILRRCLVTAEEWGLLDQVPRIKWLKVPPPDFDFLDFDEADRLLEATDPEWFPMVLTALRTGLRQGELLALRWDDVDLVDARLQVRRSVWKGHISTPKSNRFRTVPLSGQVVDALKQHRHLCGELVFCQPDGSLLTYTGTRWCLWRACRRAGLRKVQWHMLRHSFASHLVMQGVPLKAVQELLGHSTIQMTMRYAHLAPSVHRDAIKVLDRPLHSNERNGSRSAKKWTNSGPSGEVDVESVEKL